LVARPDQGRAVREDARHRQQVADVPVDDAEQRDDLCSCPAQGMSFCNIGMSAFLPYLRIKWTWPGLAASTMSAYRMQRAIALRDNSKAKSSEVHSNHARVFFFYGEHRA
jgi:hypothetical protein